MRANDHWVVDASVALKWYLRDEEFLPQADGLLEAFASGTATLTAPSFIGYEIANAFVVAKQRGRISHDQLLERLQNFQSLGITQPSDDEDTIRSAVEITSQVPVAFYDALYLAVAQGLSYRFVTADKRLHDRTEDKLQWVVWIGDLEANP